MGQRGEELGSRLLEERGGAQRFLGMEASSLQSAFPGRNVE